MPLPWEQIQHHDREIARLQIQVGQLKRTLRTLIAWTVQSANTPIRQDEALQLIGMLDGHARGQTHDGPPEAR